MKVNQFGRSMVEMLGVLAIIGVLSVGSIAGYYTAMKKYRLNKQAISFNMLLSNALQISESINKAKPSGITNDIYYNEFLYRAKLLPDGIVYKKEKWNMVEYTKQDQLLDEFGNKMSFYSRTSYNYSFGLFIGLANNAYSADICRNIINIAKEHSQNILRVHREDETSGATDKTFILSDCSQGTCFRDLNSDVITNMCRTNNKNAKGFYRFFILW